MGVDGVEVCGIVGVEVARNGLLVGSGMTVDVSLAVSFITEPGDFWVTVEVCVTSGGGTSADPQAGKMTNTTHAKIRFLHTLAVYHKIHRRLIIKPV